MHKVDFFHKRTEYSVTRRRAANTNKNSNCMPEKGANASACSVGSKFSNNAKPYTDK